MMPGETIHSGAKPACECGIAFKYEVMMSGAGYFVGTMCHTRGCQHSQFTGEPLLS